MRLKIDLDSFKKDMDLAIMDTQHSALVNWAINKESNEMIGHIFDHSYLGSLGSGFKDIDLVFRYKEDEDYNVDIIEITDNGRLKELLKDISDKIDKIPDTLWKDDVNLTWAYKALREGSFEVFHVKQFLLHLIRTIMSDKDFKWSRPSAKAIDELRVKYVKASERLSWLLETFEKEYDLK